MICPQHFRAIETARPRALRRAMASASVKMPRRRVRVFPGFFGLSVGWWGPACPDLLTRARFRFVPRGGSGPAVLRESRICRMPDDFLGDLAQFWGNLARCFAGAARWGGARAGAGPAVPISGRIRLPDPPDPAKNRALLLTTNAHTSERNLFGQVRFSELEWWHLGAASPDPGILSVDRPAGRAFALLESGLS